MYTPTPRAIPFQKKKYLKKKKKKKEKKREKNWKLKWVYG
jgi:hypothetical protein